MALGTLQEQEAISNFLKSTAPTVSTSTTKKSKKKSSTPKAQNLSLSDFLMQEQGLVADDPKGYTPPSSPIIPQPTIKPENPSLSDEAILIQSDMPEFNKSRLGTNTGQPGSFNVNAEALQRFLQGEGLPMEATLSDLQMMSTDIELYGIEGRIPDSPLAAEQYLMQGGKSATETIMSFYNYDKDRDLWVIKPEFLGEGDPSGGGGSWGRGGRGGGGSSGGVKWTIGDGVEGAPDWWVNKIPSKRTDQSQYLMMINSMIPYLSPEDQRAMAAYLYQTDPKNFAEYDPELVSFPEIPTLLDTDTRFRFSSTERANQALGTLNSIIEASGFSKEKMGPGYQFLQNVLSMLSDYGGSGIDEKQTRVQSEQQLAGIQSLLEGASGRDLSPYQALASALANPFFSAGQVTEISKDNNDYIFGRVNPRFFT